MPPRTRAGAAPCGARRGLTCSVSPLCLGAAAMENKGLNVFNTSCVLAKPETGTLPGPLRRAHRPDRCVARTDRARTHWRAERPPAAARCR